MGRFFGGRGRSKFGNKRTDVDGISFQSKAEAERFCELRFMAQAGVISFLRRQVSFDLVVNNILICRYRADFVYVEGDEQVVEDVKGFLTDEYIIKRQLMLACHGIAIREIKKGKKR